MKLQYKAGFLTKSVFDQLRQLLEQETYKYTLLGLLDHVTSFDVITQLNLHNPADLNTAPARIGHCDTLSPTKGACRNTFRMVK